MGFNLKIKARRLARFLAGNRIGKSNFGMMEKRPSWITHITHGHHVIKKGGTTPVRRGPMLADANSDLVVVQREQIRDLDIWYFGLSDAQVGGPVSKYLQSHLFDTGKLDEFEICRKSKVLMRKAYEEARSKVLCTQKEEEEYDLGSASVMVLKGQMLVMANMGDYGVVVCKDGATIELPRKHKATTSRHWSRRIIPDRMLGAKSSRQEGMRRSDRTGIVVGSGKIDLETEFVILASSGIWEVMNTQEAVNLIMHIHDPKEAARCLANEALNRMSRGHISSLVIRFDQHL